MLLFLLISLALGQWSSLSSIFPEAQELQEVLEFLQKTGFQPQDIAEMPSPHSLNAWGLKAALAWRLYQSQKSLNFGPTEDPEVSSNPLVTKNRLAAPSPLVDNKCKLSRRFWSKTQQQLRDTSTVLVSVNISSNASENMIFLFTENVILADIHVHGWLSYATFGMLERGFKFSEATWVGNSSIQAECQDRDSAFYTAYWLRVAPEKQYVCTLFPNSTRDSIMCCKDTPGQNYFNESESLEPTCVPLRTPQTEHLILVYYSIFSWYVANLFSLGSTSSDLPRFCCWSQDRLPQLPSCLLQVLLTFLISCWITSLVFACRRPTKEGKVKYYQYLTNEDQTIFLSWFKWLIPRHRAYKVRKYCFLIGLILISWCDDLINSRETYRSFFRTSTYMIPTKVISTAILLISPPILWYFNRLSQSRWYRPMRKYPINHIVRKFKLLMKVGFFATLLGTLFLVYWETSFFGSVLSDQQVFFLTLPFQSSGHILIACVFAIICAKFAFSYINLVIPIPALSSTTPALIQDAGWVFLSLSLNTIWFISHSLIAFSASRFIASAFVGWGITLVLYQQFFPLANLIFTFIIMCNEALDDLVNPYLFSKYMMLGTNSPAMSWTVMQQKNAALSDDEPKFRPMGWETFYSLCQRSRLEAHHEKTLVKFAVQVVFVVTIFMCIVTLGITQGSLTALVSTLLPFLPKLMTRFAPFADLWTETTLLHVVSKDRLLAAKKFEEEQENCVFILLRRDPESVADSLFPKWTPRDSHDPHQDTDVVPLLAVDNDYSINDN